MKPGALLAVLPLLLLMAAIGPAQGQGRISPIAIAADAIDSDPDIRTRDYQGHKAWSILWPRDGAGRSLHLGFIEGLKLPYRDYPQEMLAFAHDARSDEPAEQSLDFPGRAEQVWGRDVFWLVTSERAVLEPDRKKPETTAGNKLHRGDARRHCVVFTTDPVPRDGSLVGAFCHELAAGTVLDRAAARQWLDDLDLVITRANGGLIQDQ